MSIASHVRSVSTMSFCFSKEEAIQKIVALITNISNSTNQSYRLVLGRELQYGLCGYYM